MDYGNLINLYGSGLYLLGDWSNWILVIFGTGIGVLFGALPGITSTMSLVVFTPLTFKMEAGPAFLFLIAIYLGSVFGGAIAAVCVNIPGTPAAMVTTLDGYPLGLKGEAGKAISVATIASVFGSIIGLIALMLLAPFMAEWVKQFGSWEMATVALMGMSIVSFISEGPMVKGLIGGAIGLLIATVGYDPVTAFPRFTGGQIQLTAGLNDIVIMIGVFGVSEVLVYMSKLVHMDIMQKIKMEVRDSFSIVKKYWLGVIRSSLIGTIIGIIPAAGGGIGSVCAYGAAKQFSKEPEKFGTGHYEGIVSSESANNASVGGALLPMMTLGIPGDPMTAVLIGGLMLHGLVPGPLLFQDSPQVVSAIFLGLALSTVFMLGWGLLGAKVFSKALSIPAHLLYPTVLIFCVVGTFVLRYSLFDVGVMIVSGIIAFFLRRIQISPMAIILGVILGPMVEENFRRCMMLTQGSFLPFFTRPISLIFILITVALFIGGVFQSRKLQKSNNNSNKLNINSSRG